MASRDSEARAADHVRSDVRRNHQALIDAGLALFVEQGELQMSLVAPRAGLGQATLHRHFPARGMLVVAILDALLSDFEQRLGPPDRMRLETVLSAITEQTAQVAGLQRLLVGTAYERDLDDVRARLVARIEAPLREAQRGRRVSPEIDIADVLMLMQMVSGATDIAGAEPRRRRATAARASRLALRSLTSQSERSNSNG